METLYPGVLMDDIRQGRTLPHNEDAERAVLGAILINANSLQTAMEHISPSDFYHTGHRCLFAAFIAYSDSAPLKTLDQLSIIQFLKSRNQLDECGGISYITGLTENVSTTASVGVHAQIIRSLSLRRQFIQLANEFSIAGYDDSQEIIKLIDESETRLSRLAQGTNIDNKDLDKMSGHSKWANIQHRKGRQDAKRSNLWTKLVREIIVAARVGGSGDPDMNSRLRLAISKARDGNVPKDTIQNAILKGTGQLEGVNYEEVRYEGYGIGGASLIIDCTTDNRTRTVADVRHALSKHGGNMGTEGSVSFQFRHCGEFLFAPGTSEDTVMEVALEAGADDVVTDPDDGSIDVVCDPAAFDAVSKAFEAAGLTPVSSEITMKPLNEVELKGEDAAKMQKLIDALEDLDDVSNVYTSAVFDEE